MESKQAANFESVWGVHRGCLDVCFKGCRSSALYVLFGRMESKQAANFLFVLPCDECDIDC
jgi:hypothetical protein